jgi:hypothetical protein
MQQLMWLHASRPSSQQGLGQGPTLLPYLIIHNVGRPARRQYRTIGSTMQDNLCSVTSMPYKVRYISKCLTNS